MLHTNIHGYSGIRTRDIRKSPSGVPSRLDLIPTGIPVVY